MVSHGQKHQGLYPPGAGPGRAGQSIFHVMDRQKFIWWAAARPSPSNFHLMSRGPAHQFLREWAAARPSLSHFQKFTARPGPLDFQICRPGPVHDIGGEAHETRALYGLARHSCGPARGFDGPGNGPAHVLSRTKRRRHMCLRSFSIYLYRLVQA